MIPLLTMFLLAAFPAGDEALHYNANWPSGLSIGEGRMQAHKAGANWEFEFSLQGAIPGFEIQDTYRSVSSADFCAVEFSKQFVHGKRKASERTVVDAQNGIATRTTENGGKSDLPVGQCTRDALGFLYYLRRELGQGRIPQPQAVLFGSLYDVRLEFGGTQTITVNSHKVEADRILGSVRGPASDHTFEIFVSRDAARTPLRIRVPFPVSSFTLDLVR